MSMFGGSWTEDQIAELRRNGEHEEADRIIKEQAFEHGQSSAFSEYRCDKCADTVKLKRQILFLQKKMIEITLRK